MNIGMRIATACLIGGMWGCASAPIRFYSLAPPPGDKPSAVGPNVVIEVRVVHLPSQLNRAGIVLRTGSSEIVVLEDERWASPLKDEIQQALRLELQRRMGKLGVSAPSVKLALDLDVLRFEAEAGGHAWFEANWSLRQIESGTGRAETAVVNCTFRAEGKIGAGYAAIVGGYQNDIAALADAVVAGWEHRTHGFEACRSTISG